jgi:hypothetical protein
MNKDTKAINRLDFDACRKDYKERLETKGISKSKIKQFDRQTSFNDFNGSKQPKDETGLGEWLSVEEYFDERYNQLKDDPEDDITKKFL